MTRIERRFLEWDRPLLPSLVEELVREETTRGAAASGAEKAAVGDEVLDLSGHLFILPGSRPGRRLLELMVWAAEQNRRRLNPPRIGTLQTLLDGLHRPARPPADDVTARRAWIRTLRRSIPPERLSILVAAPPDPDDPSAWTGLASTVQDLHSQLTREGLHFGHVADACRSGQLYDDSRRWELLGHLRGEYLRCLERWGQSDRYEARIEAVENDQTRPFLLDGRAAQGIHLVGVADLPRLAERMITGIAGEARVTAWIHAPEELADGFDSAGRVRPEYWVDRELSISDDELSVGDGPGDQADHVLRFLAGLDGRYRPDEIAVGIPDREMVPWLEQRLRIHELPHRVARGTPLAETGPYRLLESVAAYLDSRRFSDLAALLRHPDIGSLVDSFTQDLSGSDKVDFLDVVDFLDRVHEAHLPDRIGDHGGDRGLGKGLDELTRVLAGPEILDGLDPGGRGGAGGNGAEKGSAKRGGTETDGAEHGGDRSRKKLSEWMPPLLAFLARTYGGRTLNRRAPGDRMLVEALESIRERASELHGLGSLPDDADPPCSAPAAIRCLLAEVQGEAVPPEPVDASMELLEWLELHLDDAPVLVVTGLNEGRLQGHGVDHQFLPDGLRSALGIPDDRSRHARDLYYLSAIQACRDHLHVVAGRRTGSGDPLRPSRLLLAEKGPGLARRVLRFAAADDDVPPIAAPGAAGEATTSAVQDPVRPSFSAPPRREIALSTVPTTFRVTEFKTLIQDPFRWCLERHMGLRERHDGRSELDALAFGTLAHDVLQRYARKVLAGGGDASLRSDPVAIRHTLFGILERLAGNRFGERAVPAVALQLEQLRLRLSAFAELQARRAAEGWEMVGAEMQAPDGVSLDVDDVPVTLRGRIDRIDIHREMGAIALLDYKTGNDPTDPEKAHRKDDEWIDLQLPLYEYLLRESDLPAVAEQAAGDLPDPSTSAVELGYVHLPRNPDETGIGLASWTRSELDQAVETARELIRGLRANPVVTFDPAATRTWRGDPLAPLLGRGILILDEEEPGDETGGEG